MLDACADITQRNAVAVFLELPLHSNTERGGNFCNARIASGTIATRKVFMYIGRIHEGRSRANAIGDGVVTFRMARACLDTQLPLD